MVDTNGKADGTSGRSGRCLCGAVSYRVDGQLQPVLHCHCQNCRRTSGSYVAAARALTQDLNITDPQGQVRWHDLGYARYGFCSQCGSSLFWRAADHGELTSIMTGTLDDDSELELSGIWFASQAQPHHVLDQSVDHFEANGNA